MESSRRAETNSLNDGDQTHTVEVVALAKISKGPAMSILKTCQNNVGSVLSARL